VLWTPGGDGVHRVRMPAYDEGVPSEASDRAVILAVDDDPDDLAVLARELRNRYGHDYDVRCERSAAAGLRLLHELQASRRLVALVLASQWMGEMPGTDLLGRVRGLHPTTKRGLLIRWGDRASAEPILQAMALGGFDYYLPKPGVVADEGFHSIVEDFLAEWAKAHGRGFAPVTIVGDPASRRVHELRDLLTRNGLLHRVHEPGSVDGASLLRRAGVPADAAPVVMVVDAPPMIDPTNTEIADALGVSGAVLGQDFDVVVIGAGPGGLGAAVYGASEGLRTLVVEREAVGGQAGTSSRIRNFLGFPTGVSGSDLAIRAYEQAWLFGANFVFMREAVGLRVGGSRHTVVLSDGSEVSTRTVVLAAGVAYRRLDVPSLDGLIGAGVFYGAAVSEAPAVRDRTVFVAGGGNSAGQAALHLARYASSVTMLVRGADLARSMSDYLVTEISAQPNVAVRTHVEIVGGAGAGRLESLTLRDTTTGRTETTPAFALFVLIGAEPRTQWLPPEIERDTWGYVVTGHDLLHDGKPPERWPLERPPMLLETSAPGVFAVGDVRHRSIKRVASAVGEGATCISLVHDHLAEH
jgi:thioredoxin reductase (NADPH)